MYLHTIAFISVYNLTGWWFQPSEKYEFVSWDDDIPKIWKVLIHSMVPKCSKLPTS